MISAVRLSCVITISASIMLVARASAQTSGAVNYSARSITLIAPGPVSGSTDTLRRVVADKLRGVFGKAVAAANRSEGVGSIGVAAQPDGHTLLCTTDAPIVLSSLFNRNLPYDAQAFERIISLGAAYSVIALWGTFRRI